MPAPSPGDFGVVSAGGPAGRLVALGEKLNGSGFSQYQHAFIYIGNSQVVQAEPAGACIRPLTGHTHELWSSGIITLTGPQRTAIVNAAHRYAAAEVDYSFLDYLALAARRFRLPIPGLRWWIRRTRHMICSALVDRCYADAGVHLFDDGRIRVTPVDRKSTRLNSSH